MKTTLTNQADVREAFWMVHPQYTRRGRTKQNDYHTDIRVAFVDFVDQLRREKVITEKLAMRVTL